MNRKEKGAALTELDRVIRENASLLGETPELGVRLLKGGVVKIVLLKDGRAVRGEYRQYASLETALAAAAETNRRARAVGAKIAGGMDKATAMMIDYEAQRLTDANVDAAITEQRERVLASLTDEHRALLEGRTRCLLVADPAQPWSGWCVVHDVADTAAHHFDVHPNATND